MNMHIVQIMCATQHVCCNIVSDMQYLCQMSWTSWCDEMLQKIHSDLFLLLVGGTTIIIIVIIQIILFFSHVLVDNSMQ